MKKYFPLTINHIFQVVLVGMVSAVTMNAHADALDELGSRPMTVNERQFVEHVINNVERTFLTPDGETMTARLPETSPVLKYLVAMTTVG